MRQGEAEEDSTSQLVRPSEKERARERESERARERQRERQRDRETERQRETERDGGVTSVSSSDGFAAEGTHSVLSSLQAVSPAAPWSAHACITIVAPVPVQEAPP